MVVFEQPILGTLSSCQPIKDRPFTDYKLRLTKKGALEAPLTFWHIFRRLLLELWIDTPTLFRFTNSCWLIFLACLRDSYFSQNASPN